MRELRSLPLLPGVATDVTVYSDGACSGNPGPGGWAALIFDDGAERAVSGSAPQTTNQRMELTAAIEGLAAIPGRRRVHLHTDSAYVAHCFRDGWWRRWQSNGWLGSARQPVANRDLWERLIAESGRHDVVWHKVKGHADDVLNNRVDAVEDTSRKLAEISGVEKDAQPVRGQGGPARPVDSAAALAALVVKTARLEREMRDYEDLLRRRGMTPSIWPVSGKLESGMGGRRNPFGGRGFEYHEGQDIDASYGTPVMVAAGGTITIAGRQRGYGNVIYVDHGAGLSTRYGHLSEIDVKIGQTVTRGQTIGLVGSTGRSTGPHLHYEVRINNQPVDPRQYLPGAER